jgi:uncharacterized protein (DUF1778 family)
MQSKKKQKSERIDIRTTATAKHLLQTAAAASHKNVSEFLLEHGLLAAEQTLADRRLFLLEEKQWQQFQEALDAEDISPARAVSHKPNLAKLLTESGVFD